jgi:RNA polymerase sigma-70 factor (ECF subfamily)
MLNIARNAAIDELRSKGFRDSQKNQSLSVNADLVKTSTAPKVTDVGLRRVMGKLREELRVLVDLSYFQGFTHEEISRTMNIPLGTVKTRIRTALSQLRTMIS